MSSGPVGRVSQQDKQLVQKLIERCLQHYMNQEEVVETLLDEAEIEPSLTEFVWQNLEEENREFFEAYYLRLMVKHQIIEYNKLLEQQVQLMHQMHPTEFSSISTSNGSHIPPMPQNSACYPLENAGPSLKQEDFHHPIAPSLPSVFTNGSSSVHTGSTPYMFGADGNVLEACPPFGDASVAVASFGGVESSSQPLNDPLLDADISSIGILDILESYASSPFLATDNENFFESHEREHQGDNRRLDSIQESMSFKDYGQ
ncbi:hypothetical protein SLA2020_030020 [Shorea laevis]